MRQRGLTYPYELVRMLTPSGEATQADLPPGEFVEHDLDDRTASSCRSTVRTATTPPTSSSGLVTQLHARSTRRG